MVKVARCTYNRQYKVSVVVHRVPMDKCVEGRSVSRTSAPSSSSSTTRSSAIGALSAANGAAEARDMVHGRSTSRHHVTICVCVHCPAAAPIQHILDSPPAVATSGWRAAACRAVVVAPEASSTPATATVRGRPGSVVAAVPVVTVPRILNRTDTHRENDIVEVKQCSEDHTTRWLCASRQHAPCPSVTCCGSSSPSACTTMTVESSGGLIARTAGRPGHAGCGSRISICFCVTQRTCRAGRRTKLTLTSLPSTWPPSM